jgi:hypothetical protein
LEAARIITGLQIFTNTYYLYRETGWERLEERRTRRKLQLLYNIQNGSTPSYLLDLIPPTIQSTTIYPLRYGNIELRIAYLNLDSVSRLRTERLTLFHSLTVAETKESLVKDSLQNGTIISLPFRRG